MFFGGKIMKLWIKAALPIVVAVGIWSIPTPEGMPPEALPFLAVFLGVMVTS